MLAELKLNSVNYKLMMFSNPLALSFIGVATASMVGSVHCLAMCGGFLPLCVTTGKNVVVSQCFYSLGRLTTYLCLGFFAGLSGQALDVLGATLSFQRFSALIVGIVLVATALTTLAGRSVANTPLYRVAVRLSIAVGNRLPILREGYLRSLCIGLSTTLLPCGWLYSFVALAAGSGSATHGVLLLFAFWLGTLPLMLIVGASATKLLQSSYVQRLSPLFVSVFLLVMGIVSIREHLKMSHHHPVHKHGVDTPHSER